MRRIDGPEIQTWARGTDADIAAMPDDPLNALATARTRAAQESNRRGLLNSSMGVQAGEEAVLNVALPIASQQAGQVQKSNLAGGQIASTEGLAARDLGSRETLTRETLASQERTAGAEIASKEAISEAGIAAQERIAASGIAAFEREKATAALAQFDNNYQEAFRTISANEDLSAETREQYLTHLAALRDTNINLVEQLYNIDLVWESTVPNDDGGPGALAGAGASVQQVVA